MKMTCLLVLIFFALNSFHISTATDCTLPSQAIVNQLLKDDINSGGGEGVVVTIRGGPYYTCQVQGTTKGTYQELSAIMEYTASLIDRVGQFEMICQVSPDGWGRRIDSLTVLSAGSGVTYDGSIGLWTNCSSCINTADNDNNCKACNSACNSSLMRCTGSGSGDCCFVFEEDGACSTDNDCNSNNFVANAENNFTCACDLTCPVGYELNSPACTCTLSDICQADNPCNNNGSCMLGSSPDAFTCNCTGTGFIGNNCTDPEPVVMTTSESVSPTPVTPMSSSVSAASPSPSPLTCPENCSECNTTCCTSCANNYTLSGCTCISITRPPLPVTCEDQNCQECRTNRGCCERCEEGYTQDRLESCSCALINPTSSSAVVTARPTSTGVDDGTRTDAIEQTGIAVIIPSIILAILVFIILIVLIAYIVYYFWSGSAAAASKAKLMGNPFSGEAHDNPMYLSPESFD